MLQPTILLYNHHDDHKILHLLSYLTHDITSVCSFCVIQPLNFTSCPPTVLLIIISTYEARVHDAEYSLKMTFTSQDIVAIMQTNEGRPIMVSGTVWKKTAGAALVYLSFLFSKREHGIVPPALRYFSTWFHSARTHSLRCIWVRWAFIIGEACSWHASAPPTVHRILFTP